MNEVEKYGLFAVVIVGGLITGIAWWGAGDELPVQAETTTVTSPVAIPFSTAKPNKSNPRIDNDEAVARARREESQAAALREVGRNTPSAGAPANRNLPVARTVQPLVPSDKPFDFAEPPVGYPGERSVKPSAAPAPGAPSTHKVREGETLSSIAKTYLGSAGAWQQLVKLNPGLDPDLLQVGQVIKIKSGPATPAADTTAAKPATSPPKSGSGKTYLVKAGDTLGTIAQQQLGSVKHTEALFQANRATLASPDKLVVGQTLIIP